MRENMTKYIGTFLMLFIIGGFVVSKPCQAASAGISINTDSTEITVGDDISVYINIDSDTAFGNFEANLTYDDDLIQYNGGASVVSGGSGFLKISDMNVSEGDNTRKYILKFEAVQVGICEISLSGVMVYDFDTNSGMSVSRNDLTLNINAPDTASPDTNLKSLKTSPSEITPAFDAGIYEYDVNVGYDTEQLVISAIPEDSKAIVSISGNDSLKEGENKVIITVLAESGAIIEYTINVFREYAPKDETTATPVISPGATEGTIVFTEIDGIKYATINSGRYTLLEPDSSVAIPEDYQLGTLTISDITIPAYLPIKNKESEFILIYAMNSFGDAGFYQYDRIEKTIQRYALNSKLISGNPDSSDSVDAVQTQKYHDNLTRAVVVIALLSAFCAFMIFVTIRMFFKLKGYKEDDLD